MDVNPKQRRRHSAEFKAQVLAACAEPGASVAAIALSLPPPSPPSAPAPAVASVTVVAEAIHLEFKRGALGVSVAWPVSAAADCAAWRRTAGICMIRACKRCDPWAYLRDVLTRMPTQLNSRIDELLPHIWQSSSEPAEGLEPKFVHLVSRRSFVMSRARGARPARDA